jgi:hypothetical protein
MGKDLVDALDHELSQQATAPTMRTESAELLDLLVSALADRVAIELQKRQNGDAPAVPEALLSLARSIREERQSSQGQETDAQTNDSAMDGSQLDNQEKSPKYANIESLLRYDEARDLGPGVKLVIMNFND